MSAIEIAAVIVIVIAIAIAVVWYVRKQERTKKLRAQFGPEYDHAVVTLGNRTKAEAELLSRRERMEKIRIRALSEENRDYFATKWHQTQSLFVDDPPGSIREADRLVCELMRVRGYPVSDFENRAADLSVDHPLVVRSYRAAHNIAQRLDQGNADTEDLRRGFVHYRELFDELLEVRPVGPLGRERQ